MIEINMKNARMWSIMGINPSIWSIGFNEVVLNKDNVALLTADLARYSGLMRTFNAHPDKCYNVGIAEQNMVSVAAGMAMTGVQPFMTTYAPFMTMRCADQVRHLMGDLNLNMKAIGSAAGLSGGFSGPGLQVVSDIALMRSIPNMVVLSPADCVEAIKMIVAMADIDAPVYMRFCGSVNLPMVYTEDYDFQIGKIIELQHGSKVALLATGTEIVSETLKASKKILEETGLQVTVANVHTIKPIDKEYIRNLTKKHSLIVSIEEHNVIGGMGSAIAEVLSEFKNETRMKYIGIQDKIYIMGRRPFLLEQTGLTVDSIADAVIKEIELI